MPYRRFFLCVFLCFSPDLLLCGSGFWGGQRGGPHPAFGTREVTTPTNTHLEILIAEGQKHRCPGRKTREKTRKNARKSEEKTYAAGSLFFGAGHVVRSGGRILRKGGPLPSRGVFGFRRFSVVFLRFSTPPFWKSHGRR